MEVINASGSSKAWPPEVFSRCNIDDLVLDLILHLVLGSYIITLLETAECMSLSLTNRQAKLLIQSAAFVS